MIADEMVVFSEVVSMLHAVLGECGSDVDEITMETRFHDDLDLESIDLVTLGGYLGSRYGERVNLADFLASLELEEIISLTIGRLVTFVTGSLRADRETEQWQ
ncbi:phosphopantetheine-binding protein [Streptomyces sp. NPDC006283]|uniref:acyl carrier protein n=1 Tax=Streptomyces sp. NPDC006283 TaxID=3156741 RepID=UPI0033BF599F